MGKRGPTRLPDEIKTLRGTKNSTRDRGMKKLSEVYRDGAIADAPVPARLSRKDSRDRWVAVTTRLISLSLIYPEDLPHLENAFYALDQSYHVLDRVKRLETLERSLEAKVGEWEPNVWYPGQGTDASKQRQLIADLSRIRSDIARAHSDYVKLTRQYNEVLKDFYATPAQKVRGIDLMRRDEPKQKKNPILDVLKK